MLKRLLFADNAVSQLPDTVGTEQMPTCIDASRNQLETLISCIELGQQQIDLRRFRMVETFLLAGNQLSSLPRHFDQLPSLETLDLADNKLGSFTFPQTVSRLSVAGNPLNMPHDDPRGSLLVRIEKHSLSLTHLDLSRIQLVDIPIAVCNLRQLIQLNLSHNNISAWPDKLFRLRNLKTFKFSHNAVSSLERRVHSLK